ncbi:hypothetical protein ACLOJK_039648, partial [Asimina triloba]
MTLSGFILEKPAPKPMTLPYHIHLFNGHLLRLGEEYANEDGHGKRPTAVEEEEGILQVAEHGVEELGDDECKEHVDRDVDALPCRPHPKWEDLAGNQPPERAPRPGKSSN